MSNETSNALMKRVLHMFVFVFAAAAVPHLANASCDSGASPSYDDVGYVRISIYSLVGQFHPWFTYEGSSTFFQGSDRSSATLIAKRATKFSGQWEAVDPKLNFRNVVGVLKRDNFFEMRLHQSANYYLDGPEDEIIAGRCGVETIVTTLPPGGHADLDDSQGKALFRLERDLQDTVFAQQWRIPQDGDRGDSGLFSRGS